MIGIYCRKSSGVEEENISINQQQNLGKVFCDKRNLDFEIYSEVVSGSRVSSKSYNELIRDIESGKLTGIWLWEYNRLERNIEVYTSFRNLVVDYKKKYGKVFWIYLSNNEKINLNDDSDRFVVGFKSLFGEYERVVIKNRMIRGKEFKMNNGEMIVGNVGFGYKRVGGKILVDKEEGKWVKRVYKMFLDKRVKSYYDVNRRLKMRYEKSYNNDVGVSLITKILNNDRYLGFKEVEFNGKKYKYEYESLVDEDIFLKCKDKIRDLKRFRKKRNDEGEFLLKGKVYCESCGESMWIVGSNNELSNGEIVYYRYYSCNNIIRKVKSKWNNNDVKVSCNSLRRNKISLPKLENVVWNILFDVLSKSEYVFNEYEKKYSGEKVDLSKKESRLNYYKNKIEEDKKKLIKEMRLIGDDEDFEDIINELKKEFSDGKKYSEKRIKELELDIGNIEGLEKKEDILSIINDDLKLNFQDKKFKNRSDLLNKYVDKVFVKKLDDVKKVGKYDIKVRFKFGGKLRDSEEIDDEEFKNYMSNRSIENDSEDDNIIYILKNGDLKVCSLVYKCFIVMVIDFRVELNGKNEIVYMGYNIKV